MKTAEEWSKAILADEGLKEIAASPEIPDACESARREIALATAIVRELNKLLEENTRLQAKYRHAIGILQAVQHKGALELCPVCHCSHGLGHSKHCELDAVLKEAEELQ